ncbi:MULTISPECIES: hypothetical protein [Streptomyces]|uniref:hypothetical protein n=1 Tax=Streptomyces TaxID=1883 RepID=UPI001D0AF1B9|nr:hypothetical protein [Streptomyces longhuiensis]UDL96910.1 hypothetical protein LGI35_00650 [Streptomyces longhuiensis]
MSPQNDQSSASHRPRQELVDDVLARFDAYARIRAGRDSVFEVSRSTPQQEQRAFDDLEQAVARLRSTA